MYQISITKKQKDVIDRAIKMQNQVWAHQLDAVVDDFLEVCSDQQRRDAAPNVEKAKKIMREVDIPPHEKMVLELDLEYVENGDGYILKVKNEKQLRELQSTLDFYSRVIMAQWTIIAESFWIGWEAEEYMNLQIAEARRLLIPEFNRYSVHCSWGITNPQNPEYSKIAYEMNGVIRHHLWKERMRHTSEDDPFSLRYGVDSHPPLRVSDEPMIEVADV